MIRPCPRCGVDVLVAVMGNGGPLTVEVGDDPDATLLIWNDNGVDRAAHHDAPADAQPHRVHRCNLDGAGRPIGS